MTKETKLAAQRWAAILLSAILIPLVTWAFAKYDANNLKVSRFVQDSALIMDRDATFKSAIFDRLDRLQRGQDSIALRMSQTQCGVRINQGCR